MATTLSRWAASGPQGMLVAGLQELLGAGGPAAVAAHVPIAQAIEEIEAFLAVWPAVGAGQVAAERASTSNR